jgi:hypothetical protein
LQQKLVVLEKECRDLLKGRENCELKENEENKLKVFRYTKTSYSFIQDSPFLLCYFERNLILHFSNCYQIAIFSVVPRLSFTEW